MLAWPNIFFSYSIKQTSSYNITTTLAESNYTILITILYHQSVILSSCQSHVRSQFYYTYYGIIHNTGCQSHSDAFHPAQFILGGMNNFFISPKWDAWKKDGPNIVKHTPFWERCWFSWKALSNVSINSLLITHTIWCVSILHCSTVLLLWYFNFPVQDQFFSFFFLCYLHLLPHFLPWVFA